ncbi:LON peptidase substrate-binding domain-containing protein [Hylemonella sp. W303a]|uniref:LON peptidase substrate-binding domain-containing protein n=1 Tax=Hylemonella sp. W303a TaxID=3389873 RepID=UPI00396B101D
MATVQIPLFPLQSVLYPGGVLSLRVFEVRYLDLVQRCHKEKVPFGVVCLRQGSEVRRAPALGETEPPVEVLHDIGTLAHIEVFERPQPGLMLIRCRGGRRFQLQRSEQLKHGLWVADSLLLDEPAPTPVPDELLPLRDDLQRLYRSLQGDASGRDDAMLPIQPPLQWDDSGWLAYRWCDVLPVSPQLKQKFLAVESPLVRLELVGDLLKRLKTGAGPQ